MALPEVPAPEKESLPRADESDTLTLSSAFSPLFQHRGLRRGSVVALSASPGATSLLFALVAESTRTGSWVAIVGMDTLGLEAASELGVCLERLIVVPDPGASWSAVVAVLLATCEIVAFFPPASCRPIDARRLMAHARKQHSTLVVTPGGPFSGPFTRSTHTRWPEATDLVLSAERVMWSGLSNGHGVISGRKITVGTKGRGWASRSYSSELVMATDDVISDDVIL